MPIRLYVEEHDGSSRLVELAEGVIHIGRGTDNEVVIRDQRSSRRHCRLTRKPQGILLEDLGSSNGTVHQGKPVESVMLRPGDEFKIGLTRLVVEPEERSVLDGELPLDDDAADAASAGATSDESASSRTADEDDGILELESIEDEPADARSELDDDDADIVDDDLVFEDEDDDADADGVGEGDGDGLPAKSDGGRRSVEAPRLIAVEGPLAGNTFPIDRERFSIGRSRRASLALRDERVSGEHARILWDGKTLVVEDLDSKNGVYIGKKRIERARLRNGARLRIGTSLFEVEVPGEESAPVEAGGAAVPARRARRKERDGDGEGGEELLIRRADVARALAAEKVRQPLIAGALLVVTLILAFFLFDLLRHLVAIEDPDPALAHNLLGADWSFERAPDPEGKSGPVPGWRVLDGEGGSIARSNTGAQFPGDWALAVESDGSSAITTAVLDRSIVVVPRSRYRLEGFVRVESAFIAGLFVDWLRPGDGGATVISTQLSRAARGPGDSLDEVFELVAPEGAAHARVGCFVAGAGRALFDRISFGLAQGDAGGESTGDGASDIANAASGAESDGAGSQELSIAAATSTFSLSLDPHGRFRWLSGERVIIDRIWAGPAADRDGYSPALSAPIIEPGDRGAVHVSTSIPVVSESRWASIEAIARSTSSEVVLSFGIAEEENDSASLFEEAKDDAGDGEAGEGARGANGENDGEPVGLGVERDASRAIALRLELPSARLPVLYHGVVSGRGLAQDAAFDGVRELVLGNVADRTSLVFSTPVKVTFEKSFLGRPRASLVILPDPPQDRIDVRFVPGSLSEREAAMDLIRDALRLYEQGELGAAVELLGDLRRNWPEEKAAIARADELLAGWSHAARGVVRELESEVSRFEREPSPVVLASLRARTKTWIERLQGTAEAEPLARILSRLETHEKRETEEAAASALSRRLERARAHFEAGLTAFAEIELRALSEEPIGADRAVEVESLLQRIQSRREAEVRGIVGGAGSKEQERSTR